MADSSASPGRREEVLELLPAGRLVLVRGWLSPDESAALFRHVAALPLVVHHIRMFGRDVPEPRLTAWIGDPAARYAYSGVLREPWPWTPELALLRARVEVELGAPVNAVLVNLYRDERDSMGLHADKEPELGPEPKIASVSLGATRRFVLAPRHGDKRVLPLADGDLLLMDGAVQHHAKHGVPKERHPVGPRINLTFRRIFGVGARPG